jgi:C4-dicarboxylate-specific signal transduction histidine kinase
LTRVASLTDFSSSLAHELKQPLTAILANAQAGLRYLVNDSFDVVEIRAILSEIAEADKRAGELIHHLRLLMKPGEEKLVSIDVSQVVREVLDLMRGEFVTHDIEVRTSLAPALPAVSGDRVQLEQLVLNLVMNACEAMHGRRRGGTALDVSTLEGHDGTVQVVISDTGSGIAPDRLEQIFDPFFTTKENGIGLGLSISLKIARVHGGNLVAERREAGGTTFRLLLPAAGSSGPIGA